MEVCSIYELFLRATRDYFSHGYFYYLFIPIYKDKTEEQFKKIDRNLEKSYDVTFCRTKRYRRKKKGLANCMVLRYKKNVLIMATEGKQEEVEKREFLDIRKFPLQFAGHEIFICGFRKGGFPKATLRMKGDRIKPIKKILKKIDLHRANKVRDFYRNLSPYPFKIVNLQKFHLLKKTNKRRRRAGLRRIQWSEVQPNWIYGKRREWKLKQLQNQK